MTIAEAKAWADSEPSCLTLNITEWWWYESAYKLGGSGVLQCSPGVVDASWLRTVRRYGAGRAPGMEGK
jgi:hypothetical protein